MSGTASDGSAAGHLSIAPFQLGGPSSLSVSSITADDSSAAPPPSVSAPLRAVD